MIDKNQQRLRAEQFELEQLAKGMKKLALPPIVGPTVAEPAKVAPPVHQIKRPKTNGVPKLNFEQSWKNDIDQTLFFGDRVLIVAQGYNHTIKTRVGVFLGAKVKDGRVTSISCLVNDKVWKNGRYQNATVRRAYPSKRVYKLAL